MNKVALSAQVFPTGDVLYMLLETPNRPHIPEG